MSGEGSGSGRAELGCPGLCWAVIWFIILILLVWWVAPIVAFIYILLLPFSVCFECLEPACELLLKIVQLPRTVTRKMVNMEPLVGSSGTTNVATTEPQ